MKKVFMMVVVAMMATVNVMTQKQPTGMRMEVAEAETDKGEYSIFTYKDDDESFGYYMSLGRVSQFLGADEILGMQVDNIKETCIWLGATYDEANATLGTILDLFDKDVETTTEFKGRAVTSGERLGEPSISTCMVDKKPLGGKRLMFVFTSGNHKAHTYLSKTIVKELRMELKMDKKLHPKQHR